MKKLTYSEADKRPENFPIIAKMLAEEAEFELASGGKHNFFAPGRDILDKIKKADKQAYDKTRILSKKDGKLYRLSDIGKTPMFGGKSTDGTHHESAEIESLKKQLSKIKADLGTSSVPIKVGNKVIKVFDVSSTKGTPKSDFHFVDENNKPVLHISHKKGSTPKHFQQWGGVTDKSGPRVSKSKDVAEFFELLKNVVGEEMRQGIGAFWRQVDPKSDLAMASIYGVDYDSTDWSLPNNVRVLVQGNVKLSKRGASYIIESNHTMINPEPVRAPYNTILMATYKGDNRKFGEIKNCRVGVYPTLDRKATEL